MFNKSIVTVSAGLLLCCISFSAAAAPVAGEQVAALVDAAAQKHLQRWAEGAGLSEPQFSVSVIAGSRPPVGCAQSVAVQAADTRQPARMRFIALCSAGAGWRYEFLVRVQISARIAVLATDLPAGKVLADEDLLLERHDISNISDVISDPAEAVGMSGKRTLRAGEVLRKATLTSPTLIKRGEPVRIVARRDQVEVSMAGEALDAGARGDMVRVRNANGTVIRARVTGAGTVEPGTVPVTASPPSE